MSLTELSDDLFRGDEEVPDPPERLGVVARRVWQELAPLLVKDGLLGPRYMLIFESLCNTTEKILFAEAALMRDCGRGSGELVGDDLWPTSESGYAQQHPIVNTLAKWKEEQRKLLREFGLTPLSSKDVKVKDAGAENPFKGFE